MGRVKALLTMIVILLAVVIMLAVRQCDTAEVIATEDQIMANIEDLRATPPPVPEPAAEETMHTTLPDDVVLLAKIMQEEDGVEWPDAMIMCIGEVVLNRVASPVFPNTVRDVLYQVDGGFVQYAPVQTAVWESIEPEARYIELAERLLAGERIMDDPRIVYQALFEQGDETILAYRDTALGTTTYFCREDDSGRYA